MRPIHPFPARMAPETISGMLDELPQGAKVLDPMCGSGVVLRQAGCRGHSVVGVDTDPLAVLMSSVWTGDVDSSLVVETAAAVLANARRSRLTPRGLKYIGHCTETQQFIAYWFAEQQRNQLARLSNAIEMQICSIRVRELLQLALSRTIVTKHVGASLAWDVSHSRPHRVRTENEYDVYSGFESSVKAILARLTERVSGDVQVRQGDCRNLGSLADNKFDAIITSPPYLNAIDYLRGHKLALVWLGYSIPMIREIRSESVGTERSRSTRHKRVAEYSGLKTWVPEISSLPVRQMSIVNKYAYDADAMIREMRQVIAPHGRLVLVLADSVVRGIEVPSSNIFSGIAQKFGFRSVEKIVREIPASRRYLPFAGETGTLARRMRFESVETFMVAN